MRVKRGVPARAKHKKINAAKGMQHYCTCSYRLAKQGVLQGLLRATATVETNAIPRSWITRINNASRESYQLLQLVNGLKKQGISDRKILPISQLTSLPLSVIVRTVRERGEIMAIRTLPEKGKCTSQCIFSSQHKTRKSFAKHSKRTLEVNGKDPGATSAHSFYVPSRKKA